MRTVKILLIFLYASIGFTLLFGHGGFAQNLFIGLFFLLIFSAIYKYIKVRYSGLYLVKKTAEINGNQSKRNTKDKLMLIALLCLLLFTYWPLLLPGQKVANDFPLVSVSFLKAGLYYPQAWQVRTAAGLGEYAMTTLWSWPLDFLYGIGANLGLNFAFLERILGVYLIFILGIYSCDTFLRNLSISRYGRFVAIAFYLLSSYLVLLIDGGQFAIGLAYAWFPISFTAIEIAINQKTVKSRMLAGLTISVLGFMDIRFVYVLLILIFLRFVYGLLFLSPNKYLDRLFDWIKLGIVSGLVFVGLNFFWLLPSIMAKAPTIPGPTGNGQDIFLSFAKIGHSFLLLAPHWYLNKFGKVTPLLFGFIVIPALAFTAIYLKVKNKHVGFWFIVSLSAIFLIKGTNPPFGYIYSYLYTHFPGFSIFRDPTKFFFLLAFSYMSLIAITIDELTKRFSRKLTLGKIKQTFLPPLLTIYFLLLIAPVWLGRMTGTLSLSYQTANYADVSNVLKSDRGFARVLWIPSRPVFGYADTNHLITEATRLSELRPFVIGTVGSYETFNFLREAPFVGGLLNIASIKYLVYPYPGSSEELKPDNIAYYHAFLDQLTNLPWVGSKINDFPVPLLKIKESQDHFFVTHNTFLIAGSDTIYNSMVEFPKIRFSDNSLVFLEEHPGLGNVLKGLPYTRILLNSKSVTDLAVDLYSDPDYFIFPSLILYSNPGLSGWWKRGTADFLNWRNFLETKYNLDNQDFDYGGGWAVSEGSHELTIADPKLHLGNILLARVMHSIKGGTVGFYQRGSLVGKIDTKVSVSDNKTVSRKLTGYKDNPDQIFNYDKADFTWNVVGSLSDGSEDTLYIKTDGDINVVNALLVIPQDIWTGYLDNTQKLLNSQKVAVIKSASDLDNSIPVSASKVNVKYNRISSTKYRVTVSGLTQPATLAFSETYDPLWKISPVGSNKLGKSSYPLYSLINGFEIDSDGVYEIYFDPQKYIYPGLAISITTFVSLLTILIIKQKKQKT